MGNKREAPVKACHGTHGEHLQEVAKGIPKANHDEDRGTCSVFMSLSLS